VCQLFQRGEVQVTFIQAEGLVKTQGARRQRGLLLQQRMYEEIHLSSRPEGKETMAMIG